MQTDRAFPSRYGVELVTWMWLIALFILVQLWSLPASQQRLLSLFLVAIGLYLLLVFRILLPRFRYAPRVIYAILVVDVLLVGALRFLFGEALTVFELAFVPLIVIAAMVSGRSGVLALALFAALMNLLAQVRFVNFPGQFLAPAEWMNQVLIVGGFALIGLVTLFHKEMVSRRAVYSASAAMEAAKSERSHREDAERTARRWEMVNAVGLHVELESTPAEIYRVVGAELRTHGLFCFIGLVDISAQRIRSAYLSLAPGLQEEMESLTGLRLEDVYIDLEDLQLFKQAVTERRAVYLTSSTEVVQRILPKLAGALVARVLPAIGLHQSLVAPLCAKSKVIGLFGVWGPALQPCDEPAITALARHVAIALEKTRLLELEQKRAAQFALVGEIGTRAGRLLDLNDLLTQVPSLVVERFGFENVSILLNEPSKRQVVLRSHAGRRIDSQTVGYCQSWDIGLIGLAARTGETVVSNETRTDPRYYAANYGENLCRSELCVPLKRGSETLGVLDLQSTVPNAFDPVDTAAVEVLAGQVAAAIERSERYAIERKRAAQLALVSEIAEKIASILDPDLLLPHVAKLIRERFGFDNVAVLVLDESKQDLYVRAVSGPYADSLSPAYRQSVQVGLIGAAVREGATIIVNDVSQDPRFYRPPGYLPETGSEICIPLKIGSQVLGVLDIEAPERNAFDESDTGAMETLANQIAIALENARLYSQTKGEAEIKATLLRELSHRVKNNLTAIAGLLYLRLDDNQTPREQILTETLTRVQSMAVAHTLLAASPQARVDLLELCRRVVSDTVNQMSLPEQPFPFTVQGPSVEISSKQAASLALVLNELATNAIKYSDKNSSQACSLGIETSNGQLQLTLFNPGRLPEGFDPNAPSSSMGLSLVRTLVEKDLKGRFAISSSDGAVTSVVTFTKDEG